MDREAKAYWFKVGIEADLVTGDVFIELLLRLKFFKREVSDALRQLLNLGSAGDELSGICLCDLRSIDAELFAKRVTIGCNLIRAHQSSVFQRTSESVYIEESGSHAEDVKRRQFRNERLLEAE